MPSARISKRGVELAMPGYDVDTAPLGKMLISPQFSTMRLALMGTVTVGPFSGLGSDAHDRAIVTFPSAFDKTPIVWAAGRISATETDQTPFHYYYEGDGGIVYIDVHYAVHTTPSGFTLYVMKSNAAGGNRATIPRTWKYFVFANALGN